MLYPKLVLLPHQAWIQFVLLIGGLLLSNSGLNVLDSETQKKGKKRNIVSTYVLYSNADFKGRKDEDKYFYKLLFA